MRYRGSFVALITPFTRKGNVDWKALERLIEWHISEGTDGIVCSATTGEGPCLSDSERKKIAHICIQTAAKRIPIIVSTGVNDTRTSVRHTETAQKLGADGCLVVTPYYNKPSQKGCYLHFQEVAKVGLPTIIYHNPPRAVIRLTAETIIEISKIPNIIAIKDASSDLGLIRKIVKYIPVFSGDDDLAFSVMREGGVGSIAATANLIPRGWKEMIHHCQKGKWEKAELFSQRYLPLIKALFSETNPQCFKFALSWFRKCQPTLRLPMIPPTESTQREIKKEILRLAMPQFKQKNVLFP